MTAGVIVTTPEALRELVRDAVADALAEAAPAAKDEALLVSGGEMARLLGVSRTTMHRLRLEGCPAVRLGDTYRYSTARVMSWLEARS